VTAGAAVGVGANANVLVGGSNSSIALQPLSLQGQAGLNLAVGSPRSNCATARKSGVSVPGRHPDHSSHHLPAVRSRQAKGLLQQWPQCQPV
jgi:hypothetical protein